jgi:hypothetical protein
VGKVSLAYFKFLRGRGKKAQMIQENSLTAGLDSGADFYAMTVDNRRSTKKNGTERD